MPIDPLVQLVHTHRADLLADAQRNALARTVRPRTPSRARLRTMTAALLFAAASRLEASAGVSRPRPSTGV